MINKIYKRIHNRYSKFFDFFFFLKYVFLIFFIASSFYVIIPKFFNYEKKQHIIKKQLGSYYNLDLRKHDTIKFHIFPLPNLVISNVDLGVKDKFIILKSKKINIFLSFKNFYNFKKFIPKKIIIDEGEISLNINRSKNLISYFNKLKSKLEVRNLNINFDKDNNSIIKIKNINFTNYGFKKYNLKAEIFDKKFKGALKNNILTFKLLDTGIKAKFKFNNDMLESNNIFGSSKIILLKNFLSFDFNLDNNQLKIIKSNFRNKNLSFSLDSKVKFNPFFQTYTNIYINEFTYNFADQINLSRLLQNKNIIKKLNSKINIYYKNNKFFSNLVGLHSSNFQLSYGKLNFNNKTQITGGEVNCKGESVLTKDFPRLDFECLLILDDAKKFFKKFSIKKKIDQNSINLNIKGSINLINKKVNFKKINAGENYLANEEDRKYFKDKFENTLLKDGFFFMFKKNKIKNFILEII